MLKTIQSTPSAVCSNFDNSVTHEESEKKAVAIRVVAQKYPEHDGYGDLLFGIKLFQIMTEKYGTRAEVTFHHLHEKELKYLQNLQNAPRSLPAEDIAKKISSFQKTIILHGPVLADPLPFEVQISKGVHEILNFHEYSRKGVESSKLQGEIVRTGPGQGELGIFIDPELYSRLCDMEKNNLPYDLSQLEKLENKALSGFIQQNSGQKYFFGYSNDTIACNGFIYNICHGNKESQDSFDIVIVKSEEVKEGFMFSPKEMVERAAQFSQAKTVELYAYRSEKAHIETLMQHTAPEQQNNKRVRIIFVQMVSHSDMKRLLLSSQPEIMITGDQSLSEALSCGKVVLYAHPNHKDLLLQNLHDVAQSLDEKIAAKLLKKSILNNLIDRETLFHPSMLKSFRMLTHTLASKFNLAHNLCGKIDEFIAHQN